MPGSSSPFLSSRPSNNSSLCLCVCGVRHFQAPLVIPANPIDLYIGASFQSFMAPSGVNQLSHPCIYGITSIFFLISRVQDSPIRLASSSVFELKLVGRCGWNVFGKQGSLFLHTQRGSHALWNGWVNFSGAATVEEELLGIAIHSLLVTKTWCGVRLFAPWLEQPPLSFLLFLAYFWLCCWSIWSFDIGY